MTDEKVRQEVGISNDQLDLESEKSRLIQEKRANAGDAHMQLQINRAVEKGDIASLTPEARQALFNPDGLLTGPEVQERMAAYLREHEKIAFAPHELRKQVAATGFDVATQNYRMPNPGERVNDHGHIEMVDPRYAEEVAQKMRNADPADVKNSMQRAAAMNEVLMQVMNRVHDPIGAVYVTFEESRKLVEQFEAERREGWPEWRHDFLPTRQYMHKIGPRQRRDGTYTKPFRDLLVNEAGVFQMGTVVGSHKLKGKIVCVRDKEMTHQTGSQVSVPTQLQPATRTVAPKPLIPTQTSPPAVPRPVDLNPPVQTPPTRPPVIHHQVPIQTPPEPEVDPNRDLPPPPPGFKR